MKTFSKTLLPVFQGPSKIGMSISVFVCAMLLSVMKSEAQYNTVDWGAYFSDSTTGFSYADDELIDDIKIDNQNPENIYVVGRTRSATGTSTACAGNKIKYGQGDIMLAKYTRCGNLLWSRYLGNKKKTDYGYTLALDYDSAGNTIIYIAGEMKTTGSLPPAVVCDGGLTPFRSSPDGPWDAFIAKYDQNGNLGRWTYFGGSDTISDRVDQILGIAVSNHHVFVVGYTESPNLHVGALRFDDNIFDGVGDGFLAEFSYDLHNLEYFTYIGGTGKDRCHGIKIYQPSGSPADIFVDGTTPSSAGIASGTGFDASLEGDLDGFAGKWEDDDGDGIFTKTWATYIGGNGIERARDMDVDDSGNIIIVGQTTSTSLPWAKGYDSTYNGGTDAFVIKLPNGGGNPLWGTYFGGYSDEEAVGLTWKKGSMANSVLIGGITFSSQKTICLPNPNPNNYTAFPIKNSLQSRINGKTGANYCPVGIADAFIAELSDKDTGQTLVFDSYLGGSGNEVNGENQLSYNPSLAVTAAGELYVAFNTRSKNVNTEQGQWFQKSFGTYHGGIDGFVGRLIDGNSSQFGCDYLRQEEEISQQVSPGENIFIFPNPSGELFNLRMTADESSGISFKVLDNIGRVVANQTQQMDEGQNTFKIDMSQQSPGIYFLQITYQDNIYTSRLVKQ